MQFIKQINVNGLKMNQFADKGKLINIPVCEIKTRPINQRQIEIEAALMQGNYQSEFERLELIKKYRSILNLNI